METRDKIVATIARELREQGAFGEITEASEFIDMPIDSLGLYMMMAGVEDEYDIEFNSCKFSKADTVGQLVDLVLTEINEKYAETAQAA